MDLISGHLKENKVATYLLTKYFDDINIATSCILKGYEWQKEGSTWKLRWSAKMEEEDSHRSEELATIEKIRWLYQSLPENPYW